MSNEDIKATVCKEALEALSDSNGAIAPQLRESIEAQLRWLIDYFEGRTGERKRLFDLTFGHYAAREIDPREGRLIDALNKAFYVAVKTREGLKIDLKLLGYSS
ncbi:MAG: immunity protein Tsi6 family protein [Alcanivorax sp.]|uniref:immunity protein Tsi6 family protein n=1 Tax=Alcanivorax sp. TaxID=1872427 RepID=UPI003DA7A0FA